MTLSYYDWKIPHFLWVAIYNSLASWIIAVLSNVELVGGCYEQYKTLGPGRVYLRSGIGTNTVPDSWKCKIHISPWGTGFDCYPGSEIHQKMGMGSGIFFFHVCQEFGKSSQLDHASWTDKCGSNRRLPQCLFFFNSVCFLEFEEATKTVRDGEFLWKRSGNAGLQSLLQDPDANETIRVCKLHGILSHIYLDIHCQFPLLVAV